MLGPDEVAEWLAEHAPRRPLRPGRHGHLGPRHRGLDRPGAGRPGRRDAYLDPTALTEDDERALAAWLADPTQPKALHDAKGPMHALAARGLEFAGLTSDTALAAYLALPGQRSFDLADLADAVPGPRAAGGDEAAAGQLAFDTDTDGDAEAANALAQRARATAELADALDAVLEQRGVTRAAARRRAAAGRRAGRDGAGRDRGRRRHLAGMSASLGGEVKAAEQAAYAVVGHEFNLGSPKQLQEVLFTELGPAQDQADQDRVHHRLRGADQPAGPDQHPILEHLLRHRDVARLKSIVDSLIPMAGVDGRIHTTYNQTIAATGRLSSTDPNLQNIPIRTEEGRRTRQAFIVGDGYESLLTADYSQIELRIMAHLSGDAGARRRVHLRARLPRGDGLAGVRRAARGGHGRAAQQDQGDELRARLRPVLLRALAAAAVSADEARGLMDDYFEQFGGIRDYLEAIVAQARKDGYTQTILGRRRYLPDLVSDNRQRREMAERMALNAPIQGSAADVIKVAMLAVPRQIRAGGLRSRMLLQVHDELLFEVAAGRA